MRESILTAQESSSLSLSMHGSVEHVEEEEEEEEAPAFCSSNESLFFGSASAVSCSCFGASSVHIICYNNYLNERSSKMVVLSLIFNNKTLIELL